MKIVAVGPVGFRDFPVDVVFPLLGLAGINEIHLARDDVDRWSADRIKEKLNQYKLLVHSYHCGFGEEFDLTDGDNRVKVLENIREEMEFAAEFGSVGIVIHPSGVERKFASARNNFKGSLDKIAEYSEEYDIEVWFESLPETFSYGYNLKELREDISNFGYSRFGICFDTGHANINKTQPSVDEQIIEADGLIRFVHVHDNNGQEDEHKLPFMGTINWDKVIRALVKVGYTGSLCLEVFEDISVVRNHLSNGLLERFVKLINSYQMSHS